MIGETPLGAGSPCLKAQGFGAGGLPHARGVSRILPWEITQVSWSLQGFLMGLHLFDLRAGLWTQPAPELRRAHRGLPQPEAAELSDGHTWAGGTRTRSRIAFLLPTREYFQPLRCAGEAALQENSNTTQAPLKSSSHCRNPRRNPHHTAQGCATQTHREGLAIPKSQSQEGQLSCTHCTHCTSSGNPLKLLPPFQSHLSFFARFQSKRSLMVGIPLSR